MKYFTPELYTRLQLASAEDMDAADAVWEEAVERYEQHLQAIRTGLPSSFRQLLEGHYLHDADVLSMGREANRFTLTLQLEAPPRNLLLVTYDLTGEPQLETGVLPAEHCSPRAQWLYDEADLAAGGEPGFRHTILFSNGWQIRLAGCEVQVVEAQALWPIPQASSAPVTSLAPFA